MLARGQAGLAGVLADIEQAGARGLAIGTDVADLAQVRSAAEKIEKDLGPIQLWVNVAFAERSATGIPPTKSFATSPT